jgi:hypothetical protein
MCLLSLIRLLSHLRIIYLLAVLLLTLLPVALLDLVFLLFCCP